MGLLDRKYKVKKNKNLYESFRHAYEGIIYVITRERNMHIHVSIATLVIIAGVLFQINYAEWLACLILIGSVLSLEMINTAIESVVDLITTNENPIAKVAKDASAGAVLIMAIISAFIGVVIFLPKIFDFLINIG